jgi:hypothetical protein
MGTTSFIYFANFGLLLASDMHHAVCGHSIISQNVEFGFIL